MYLCRVWQINNRCEFARILHRYELLSRKGLYDTYIILQEDVSHDIGKMWHKAMS